MTTDAGVRDDVNEALKEQPELTSTSESAISKQTSTAATQLSTFGAAHSSQLSTGSQSCATSSEAEQETNTTPAPVTITTSTTTIVTTTPVQTASPILTTATATSNTASGAITNNYTTVKIDTTDITSVIPPAPIAAVPEEKADPPPMMKDVEESAQQNNEVQPAPASTTHQTFCDRVDNGILDFMTPDMICELYKKISTSGPPELDWNSKFYGRRKPNELNESDSKSNQYDAADGASSKEQQDQDKISDLFDQTEFDFDESFSELQAETSAIINPLQLKKRPEHGSERKTHLSDIMSDIMKETSHNESGL